MNLRGELAHDRGGRQGNVFVLISILTRPILAGSDPHSDARTNQVIGLSARNHEGLSPAYCWDYATALALHLPANLSTAR